MKIISKFKDYYDIGSSMGVDEPIVYVRNIECAHTDERMDSADVLKLVKYPFNSKWRFGSWGLYGRSATASIIVGFCGKLYPAVILSNGKRDLKNPFNNYTVFYEWDDKIHEYVTNINYGRKDGNIIQHFKKFLSLEPVENTDLFHHYKTPVFVIPNTTLSVLDMWGLSNYQRANGNEINNIALNPCLADIQFYKAVDSFTAYQEIMGFITGVLSTNHIPPVKISDEDMRDAKGFDERSFKKEPTKHFKK